MTVESPAPAPAPDLAIGAFTPEAPWVIEPDELVWRRGIDRVRQRTKDDVPLLTQRRRIPPAKRVVRVGSQLGPALAGWYLVDRRNQDQSASRAALSKRLRIAFEHLGPTYI